MLVDKNNNSNGNISIHPVLTGFVGDCWCHEIFIIILGASKLIDHLQHMINIKFPKTVVWVLLFLWKILAPVIIAVSKYHCLSTIH